MTSHTDVPATTDKPTSLTDRTGRGLLALCGSPPITAGDTPDAKATWPIDLALVLATAVAYVLCRGWYGWRSTTLASATGSLPAHSTG